MYESKLLSIVEASVDGILLIDDAGLVTLFNPACERIFGYSATEIVGQDVGMLMPAPYHHAIGMKRELTALRKSGESFTIELTIGRASFDHVTYFVGILRDITDRKRADELRDRLIAELAESNEERAHFAHVASHDLREPLRMVSAFCGLLSQHYGERLDARGREYLALAVSGSTQMQCLLDDLVDYTRLGSEGDRSAWFEAGESIDQVLENLMEAIRSSGAQITCGPMPRLYGNHIRFIRLMQNLIGNAIKYVAKGVTPQIDVSAVQEGDFWRIRVRDNGIGIEPAHFQRIFEPFKRLHGRGEYSGTGLGLAICRKVVDGFGGQILLKSTPGVGSTFTVILHAYEEETDDGRLRFHFGPDAQDDRALRPTG